MQTNDLFAFGLWYKSGVCFELYKF